MNPDWKKSPGALLNKRIADRGKGFLDVNSKLAHFSIVSYAVPVDRLRPLIPESRFEIFNFTRRNQTYGLVSAVPFLDLDFHFKRMPWAKFRFAQTNHRAYVIDKKTGEPAVWFFGTTLGSSTVHFAQLLWRLPWYRARYVMDCRYDAVNRRYSRYRYAILSGWGSAEIEIDDTGSPVGLLEGFANREEQDLVLTHPIDGYFFRRDGKMGTYQVWHPRIDATVGAPRNLYFGLYEKLGLLSRAEMQIPHSILVTPEIEFDVRLPPTIV